MRNTKKEFVELLSAKTLTDIEKIILKLGKRIRWVPLGGIEGNYSIIKMGSNPWDGITERITNSIDAIIELEVEKRPELKTCNTPRDAVEKLFELKDGNIRWCDRTQLGEFASRIKVKFLDSGEPKKPTIEISDNGIGQHPSDFLDTLLSLIQNYKVRKLYLIGAFGLGGQTSFGNCEYGIVISRKHTELLNPDQEDLFGWSIVRYFDPTTEDAMYKKGYWEYCIDAETLSILTEKPGGLPMAFNHGTLIRLISYELGGGTSDVLQPASTAWSYFNQSLFDPILPFRLYEERSKYIKSNRTVPGLARRLWRGGKGEKVRIWKSDSYSLDLEKKGVVRINYWALEPTDELSKWHDIKKGYVSQKKAFFITLNGQKHHVETTTFLRDRVELHYSHDYLIVQVDCDRLTSKAKKELLATTRERLIESELSKNFLTEIALHLKQDRNILTFESERKKQLQAVKSKKDTTRIRRMVGKYIARNPRLADLIFEKSREKIKGNKDKQEKTEKEMKDDIREEELEVPILKPIPTYLKITNAKYPIPIEKGGNALIRLETDAEDNYFEAEWKERFRINHKTGTFTKRSSSNLRNGKISYYILCPPSVRVGTIEEISFELDLPDGSSLNTKCEVACIHKYKRQKEQGKKSLHEPKIEPIYEEENPKVWAQFGWSERSVGRVILGKGEESGIYVSMENEHLKKALHPFRNKPTVWTTIEDRYLSGIAFYLLLKEIDRMKHPKDEEPSNDISDDSGELQRLAQTIAALSIPIEFL